MKKIFLILSVLVIAGMALAACQSATATATQAWFSFSAGMLTGAACYLIVALAAFFQFRRG